MPWVVGNPSWYYSMQTTRKRLEALEHSVPKVVVVYTPGSICTLGEHQRGQVAISDDGQAAPDGTQVVLFERTIAHEARHPASIE